MKHESTSLTASSSESSLSPLDGEPEEVLGDEYNEEERISTSAAEEDAILPSPSSIFRTVATILSWYCISNTIILSTKWLFNAHFPFPLTVTAIANGIAALWAIGLRTFFPSLHTDRPLSNHVLYHYVLPIGLTTALEIGCSNYALHLLSVSFGTILKGGGPIFTFLWGLILGVEGFNGKVVLCLIVIALGIALASLGEGAEFQLLGFSLQLFASSLGGLRWAMTHKLLKDGNDTHKLSPLTAILYTSPTTALCVMPFALGMEGRTIWMGHSDDIIVDNNIDMGDRNMTMADITDDYTLETAYPDLFTASELILVGTTLVGIATLVFILLLSEYWLVNATSSLALSVAAVFKELLTIGGGIFLFAEHIHLLNVAGFMTCQAGILSYVYLRYHGKAEQYTPMPAAAPADVVMQEESNKVADGAADGSIILPMEQFVDEEDEVEMPTIHVHPG